jgi:hypothetical protein
MGKEIQGIRNNYTETKILAEVEQSIKVRR